MKKHKPRELDEVEMYEALLRDVRWQTMNAQELEEIIRKQTMMGNLTEEMRIYLKRIMTQF